MRLPVQVMMYFMIWRRIFLPFPSKTQWRPNAKLVAPPAKVPAMLANKYQNRKNSLKTMVVKMSKQVDMMEEACAFIKVTDISII
jgi:hypothetical protein